MASTAPRPPEHPVKSARCENSLQLGDFNAATNSQPNEPNGNTEVIQAATTPIIDDNSNPKVMKAERETRTAISRRPASLPPGQLSAATGAQRKRGSYHQDVEEALSSLLWQPYEYRTQSDSSDTLSTLSLSTGSSSSTSLSYEYATINKNKAGRLLHSFTDEFLSMATVYGNVADPNLRPCSVDSTAQMVTNLMVLDGGVGHQCGPGARSRGHDGGSALSQVDSARSRVRELVSRCARTKAKDVQVACVSAVDVLGDNVQVSGGDMRVEIPGQPDVTFAVVPGGGAVSSDMIPSNMTSVVSANVVGLPVHSHSRSNSALSTRTVGNGGGGGASNNDSTIQPNHPRSISDSSNVFVQLGAHFRTDRLPPRHPSQGSRSITTVGTNLDTPNETNILHTRQESQPSRVPPLPNVSNVNVNFYRAVPVNVVSNVPTIQCVNSVEESAGNNVSNVHIVQAMPPPTIPTQQVHVQQSQPPQPNTSVTEVRTRTFTSTEAQTDDTTVGLVTPTVVPTVNREQRRRERRERRHQRRLNSSSHPHQQPQQQTHNVQTQSGNVQHGQWNNQGGNERLPDLLNSHLPPPYSTLPSGIPPPPPALAMVAAPPPPGTMVPFPPGVVPVVQAAPPPVPVPVPVPAPHTGFRFPFPNTNGFRRCRSRLGPRYSTEEHQPKSCCGFLVSRPGSLRWFIALIALVAVCCVLVGTVLGAMRPAGRDHLTVSLLMIGVGIVLVTVSGVAWRLTSHDAPSCRAMLGLESGDSGDVCTRRFVPRLPPSYGRPHHPYAAMIYPEFQYRPPPPSYQASMQEYRLRLLLLDRAGTGQQQPAQHAVSPPPTYRSHAGSLLRAPLSNRRDATQSEYSCPPSYRSRSSSNRQPSVDPVTHSREQSLSLSESNHDGSVVNVVNILANQEEEIALENMTLDSLKVAPENEIPPLRMMLKSSSGSDLENSKDGNLVTIVQKADQNPVIVTVSGSQMSTTNPEVGSSNQIPSEMEILAHL